MSSTIINCFMGVAPNFDLPLQHARNHLNMDRHCWRFRHLVMDSTIRNKSTVALGRDPPPIPSGLYL